MLNYDYTAELMNLEGVSVTNVENISDEVHVHLELPRTKHTCPACGAVTDRIHDYRQGCPHGQNHLPASAKTPLPL